MKPRGGDGKATAVFLWLSLFFLLSGLLLYLIFSAPPEPPRRSYPVSSQAGAEVHRAGYSCPNKSKGMTGLTTVAKVIELVGESQIGWEDAVHNAVEEASKTIGITGVEVVNLTASLDNGEIEE